MRRLPCSWHPLNHLLVQELALHAAFNGAHQPAPHHDDAYPSSTSSKLWAAAAHWAWSPMSSSEALSHPKRAPQYPRCGPVADCLTRHRLAASRTTSGSYPVVAPEKLVALYAPRAVLPPLHRYVHDTVLYDHAVQHQQALARLLTPFGLMAELTGSTRRGCPASHHVEVLLTLTAAAEAELSAAQLTAEGTGQVGDAHAQPPDAKPLPGLRLRNPAVAATEADKTARLPTKMNREMCSVVEAYASTDTFSEPVVYRYGRAMDGLAYAGYLIAGRAPSHHAWERRDGKVFSTRLDPATPHSCPHHLTDMARLEQLRLHRLVLHVAPRNCRVVRQFLLTGPAAFTSCVTLKALSEGYELNMNGLFARTPDNTTRVRVDLRTEVDLFRLVRMPYVDPINRGIYCRVTTQTASA